jgi:ABC-type multidrug transport system fused ATPase/permease subunit
MLATAIVLLFGGMFVLREQVSLGTMVAFLSYVTRFFEPIQDISQLYTTMQSAMAGGEQVLKILDTQSDVVDPPDAISLPLVKGKIEFNNVFFRYQSDSPFVIKNINLSIRPGQMVAFVGPTGAGKTTIANLVMRLYDVTEGAILIDGHDIRSVTQASLRSQTGLVPQDPFLFSGTIADNIRYSNPEALFEHIEAAAKQANIHEFISGLPNGYNTHILEGGVNLSVGQRQLICIARAILANPHILILDEATANVDTFTEVLIQNALTALLKNRTSLLIAHRLSTIRNADMIYVLDEGEIVEQGYHSDLLAHNGLYADLYKKL